MVYQFASGPLCRTVLFAAVSVLTCVANAFTAEDRVSFNRDIRLILSDNCFQCHGPDQNARKADLRLDTKEGALRGENPVIVPGKSAESDLIARITSTDPDEVMPPPTPARRGSAPTAGRFR